MTIINTHYNILDALLMANPDLVMEVAELVHVEHSLRSIYEASQCFNWWWEINGGLWHPTERAAIYTIWEVVYWAKTEPMDGGHRTWWDSIKVRLAV